jgi:hypothetical protein
MLKSRLLLLISLTMMLFGIAACTPEVGSEKWCQNMENKPEGDWTANEAIDYTKHCLFKTNDN